MNRKEAVHFLGPPGTGKSHLACAVGVAAALLDRLLHHATVIRIEGASYRLRAHADLMPEHVRINSEISPPATTRKRRKTTAQEDQKIYKG